MMKLDLDYAYQILAYGSLADGWRFIGPFEYGTIPLWLDKREHHYIRDSGAYMIISLDDPRCQK